MSSDTLMDAAGAGNAGPGHDTGFAVSAQARRASAPSPAANGAVEPPMADDLKHEIARAIAANPAPCADDADVLALMAQHDPALGVALAKLPERDGAGGAVLAALIRKYRGGVDALKAARLVALTLIFAPDPVPDDERLQDAVLRLSEFSLDAAKELARAYVFLGARFTLDYSVRVLLDKHSIAREQFNAAGGTPADGLTPAGVDTMLAQGQLDVLNELLRPFEIAIRQKIGTVNPVYSLIEKSNGRAVMPARELIEFLRKRNVFV